MEDFVEVRKYIHAIFRWWWLLILLSVVGGVIGFEIGKRQPPVYQATTTIIVGQSIQSSDLTKTDLQTSELLAQTYANIARRQPVLGGVIQALNLSDSEQELKKRVSAKQVDGTQLLEIKVEAEAPEAARRTADELARQLILQSPSGLPNETGTEEQQFIQQRLESLRTRIQNGRRRLNELEKRLINYVSPDQLMELQYEINTLENAVFEWEDKYTQLLIFVESQASPNQLAIIEPAKTNLTPVRPQPRLHALLAGTIGAMIALAFILVREYLDNTIKSTDDLSKSLGIASLGAIRRIKGKDFPERLITSNPFSPWSEAYRMIRSNIQFMSIDRPARSILVTSALPDEGKSITTANLGVVMAQTDLKTIIVDADLRRPTQHKIFQLPNSIGVTDLLRASEPDLKDYIKETSVKNLYLLTCGELPSNPSELLGSQRMARLLTSLGEFADMVIFDSPPIVAFTDAAVLSTRMDGVVLVTLAGQTRLDTTRQAVRNLQQVGADLLGGVLNGVSSNDEESYYYQDYTSSESLNGHQLANPLTKFTSSRKWRQRLPFLK